MSDITAINVAFLTAGAALVSTAVATARPRRGAARSPSRIALCASVGVLGVSFAVQSPWARNLQNEALVNLGQLTGNGTTLVAAYAMQVMVLFVLHEPVTARAKVRRRLPFLAVALGGMTAFFLTTPVTRNEFTSPAPPGGILAYYTFYCGYLAFTLVDLLRLARRRAERATDGFLRLSMRLLGWSSLVGAVYLAARLGVLAVGALGIEIARGDEFGHVEFVVAAVIPAAGAVLLVVGVAVGRWGRRLPNPARWLRHWRSYRRLRPLWEAVRDAQPHLVLPVRRGIGGGQLGLYRRVIEIQDARLAIAGYLSRALWQRIDVAVAAAGPTDDAAVREAAAFAAGLRALAEGGTPSSATDVGGLPAIASTDGTDLPAVVAWLERVSVAYATSPVVHAFAVGRDADPVPSGGSR